MNQDPEVLLLLAESELQAGLVDEALANVKQLRQRLPGDARVAALDEQLRGNGPVAEVSYVR